MIIVLKPQATRAAADELCARIAAAGMKPLYMPGTERVVLGALGDERVLAGLQLESHPMVEEVKPILSPYKLVGREFHPHDSVVSIGNVAIGGPKFVVMAGPCAVESREQIQTTAAEVKTAGASILRGGAFKPRTSPYAFQGLGREGLVLLEEAGRRMRLPTVTEIVDTADLDAIVEHADCLQVGARNMQNFQLLKAVGQAKKPVLLKRGMSARIEELLLAAEYVVAAGNENVILCERGIRTFDTYTRNTLDLNAVPYLKQKSHLPVIVDPSHGTGVRDLVIPMAKAAAACGADGLIVEVHHDPKNAKSDGHQSLHPHELRRLISEVGAVARAVGRTLPKRDFVEAVPTTSVEGRVA
jgi:3-deoxy-7-phosphoheptulonate synthase